MNLFASLFPRYSHAVGLASHPGLIILGIILDLGGGPNHDRLGFRYWKHPGPFVQFDGIAGAKGRFLGFWDVLTQAGFSFIGTEIVAVSSANMHGHSAMNEKPLLDRGWRGQESETQHPEGNSSCVHPYIVVLHRRRYHHWLACTLKRPWPRFGKRYRSRLPFRHRYQAFWHQGSPSRTQSRESYRIRAEQAYFPRLLTGVF